MRAPNFASVAILGTWDVLAIEAAQAAQRGRHMDGELTARDRFAMAALPAALRIAESYSEVRQGVLGGQISLDSGHAVDMAAILAYQAADAMLAKRTVKGGDHES